ncbi:sigma-70 family RNA polymerase sigma factor [Aquihabitans daechungensis]|uniref:sigma-70 family RNA polymerase sigma factor n=1 Tax=Aquihabitans daechungensis TaxID=1052257 RepID=UPI003BA2266F
MSDAPLPAISIPVTSVDERRDFDETFVRLLPSVKGLCWRILGSESAAEDAAAEAFIRALMRWSKLQAHPNPDAWIHRVATNVSLDLLRRRRREGHLDVHPPPEEVAGPPGSPVLGVDMRRALAGLPRRQREVVVLRHMVGLSEEETAAAMGVSVNTVKTHGARAMAALRSNTNLDLAGDLA